MKSRAIIQAASAFLALIGFAILASHDARAQQSVRPCFYVGTTCVFVSADNPLPVTGGGGGGGLSVTDQAAWTQGSSSFTPTGGTYNDSATLTSGQQGTVRLTTKRAMIIDTDTTGNALYNALTAAIPAGTNIIGRVGIDQTTPGTTNGVQVNAALPAGTNYIGKTRATDGTNDGLLDPCQTVTPTSTPINISSATTTRIITETSSVKTYICHIHLVTNAANNVALIEGTGSSCAGGTPAGMAGGTTASSGWNFSANGGISLGMGGFSVNQTANNAYSVCLVTSAATQLSGVVKWVQR